MKFRQTQEMEALAQHIRTSPDIEPGDRALKLAIFDRLAEMHRLYWDVSEIAGKQGLKRINRMILETFFEKPINPALPKRFQPLDREPDLELWQPFIQPITDQQLWAWLDDPPAAMPGLWTRIKAMRDSLKGLREKYDS